MRRISNKNTFNHWSKHNKTIEYDTFFRIAKHCIISKRKRKVRIVKRIIIT